MEISAELVEKTLHEFYHDAQLHAEANHYLTLAQVSPEAWNFVWQLLNPTKSNEVQFFGASTLHVKISRFWTELQPEQYEPLRTKLLEAIVTYSGGPKLVLTRLCIAMSSYIIHSILEHWQQAISDIISMFQPQNMPAVPPKQVINILLELLTVLPEEFQATHLVQSHRSLIRNVLQSSIQQVFALCQDILSQPSSPTTADMRHMALVCYSSWSQLGSPVLEYEQLLLCVLTAVYDKDLCFTALEALSNVATHPEAYKYPNSLLKLITHLIRLEDLLAKAIQEKDMEMCCNIYDLFISIGDSHSKLLLDSIIDKPEYKDAIFSLVRLILQCSGTPGQYPVEEFCSREAFGFWYTLQDEILAADSQKFETLLVQFHPVFQSLVDSYLVKAQYPSEEDYKKWHADEKESFRCYRQDIGDSFMYCYNILREAMLANLMAHLQISSDTAAKNPHQWQYLEACLFAFQSVAESIDMEKQQYLNHFFMSMSNLPLQHIRVISTIMDVIGAYAEWLNLHPELLNHVVPLLLVGLRNSEVAPAATMSLKDITRDCQLCMKPFAENILDTSQEMLSQNVLKSYERVRLMCTIGQVLSIMPPDYIMSYLNKLLTPLLQELQSALTEPPSASSKSLIVLHLHMVSMLFATLDTRPKGGEGGSGDAESSSVVPAQGPQPIALVLQQMLPLFSTISTKWANDDNVIEALCDALKRGITTSLEECRPVLPDILRLILHMYQSSPHTPALELGKQVMLLFHDDESQSHHLATFFAEVCNHTLSICQKDLHEHTAALEVFFQMLYQVTKKVPRYLEGEQINLSAIFQCSIATISLPEKATVKAASSFICEFISHSRKSSPMLNIVNNHGEVLVGQVLRVIGSGDSPRNVVEHMPDILMTLNKKYFDNLCRWLSAYLHQQGFPSAHTTSEQKEHFTRMILKERTNKRKIREIVQEFSLLCRGIIGTEYAAQTAWS